MLTRRMVAVIGMTMNARDDIVTVATATKRMMTEKIETVAGKGTKSATADADTTTMKRKHLGPSNTTTTAAIIITTAPIGIRTESLSRLVQTTGDEMCHDCYRVFY